MDFYVHITKLGVFLEVSSEVMFTYLTKVEQDNRKAL